MQVDTIKCHFAAGGSVNAGDGIEKSGLACTVRADQAGDHTFVNGKVNFVDCGQTAKGHCYCFCIK